MRWYAAISLLTDGRIRFLIGFVLVAIIFAIVLILIESRIREKANKEKERLILKPADRIKIFMESNKSPNDKLAFLDIMAKEYFAAMYKFPSTTSYSKLVNEFQKAGHGAEAEFCKKMFYIFYSKEGATEQGIQELSQILQSLENNRTAEEIKSMTAKKPAFNKIIRQGEKKLAASREPKQEPKGKKSDSKNMGADAPKVEAVNMADLKKKEAVQEKSKFSSWFSKGDIGNKPYSSLKKEEEIKRQLQEQLKAANEANKSSGSKDLISISKDDTLESIKKKLEAEKKSLDSRDSKESRRMGKEQARKMRLEEKERMRQEKIRRKEMKRVERERAKMAKSNPSANLASISLNDVPAPEKVHATVESKMNKPSMISKEKKLEKESGALVPDDGSNENLSEKEMRKRDKKEARARIKEIKEREKRMKRIEGEDEKRRKLEKKRMKKIGVSPVDYTKTSQEGGLASRIVQSERAKLEAEYY